MIVAILVLDIIMFLALGGLIGKVNDVQDTLNKITNEREKEDE